MKYSNVNEHPKKKNFLKLSGGVDPATLDELFECIKAVMINSGTKLTGLAFDIRYAEVSTSHDAPLLFDRSKLKNYEFPLLPGFSGRVWARYDSKPENTWGSDPFSPTLSYTGTGGYGSYEGPWLGISKSIYHLYRMAGNSTKGPLTLKCGNVPDSYLHFYSYDYRLFLDDFPEIRKTIDEMLVLHKLGGGGVPYRQNTHFEWNDPSTKLFDSAIMAEYASIVAAEFPV